MNNSLMFSSRNEEWSTPIELFNKYNKIYKFTVDVCASTSNYKVKKYWDKKDNGLLMDWSNKICWMNPPYGREISKWIKKAYEEAENGTRIVALLPARTDTKWFHSFIYKNSRCKIEFIKGRLKFSNNKNSAPFPSMIVVFNDAK